MPPLPTVEMVLVETGDTLGDLVAVEGNLQPGMMVVTRGNEQLQTGASIIPTNLMGDGAQGGAPDGMMPPEGMAGEMPPQDLQGESPQEEMQAPQEHADAEGEGESTTEGAGE